MRACGECGKNLEGSATRCPYCGSTKVFFISAPAAPVPAPEPQVSEPPEKGGGITIIFDKGHDHPVEEEAAEESLEPAAEEEEEPSAFFNAVQWVKRPVNALILGAVLLAVGGIAWWNLAPHRVQVEEAEADPKAVDSVLTREFSGLVDAALPEKLDWGREILKHRVPSRFPEELLMDADREKPEVRFSNDEKSEAYYQFLIAYHYKDTNKKLFVWTSVRFFFQLRNGKWALTGDRWPREWEVMFE